MEKDIDRLMNSLDAIHIKPLDKGLEDLSEEETFEDWFNSLTEEEQKEYYEDSEADRQL